MSKTDPRNIAAGLPTAWKSTIVGKAANANLKVLRMDAAAYPDETHSYDEALLVVEGNMNLRLGNDIVHVRSGEVHIEPVGTPHAVAAASRGTLVIVDGNK